MAKVSIKVDTKKLQKKLGDANKIVSREIVKFLPRAIFSSISKGKSPVKGVGRFVKYSDSYRSQIKNNLTFYTKNGRAIPVSKGNFDYEYSFDEQYNRKKKKARSQSNRDEASKRKFIKENNAHLKGKKVSPVNLKVSGELIKSLSAKVSPSGNVKIEFTDEKAKYHNEGTDKIPRRAMLPTESGEKFARSITLRLQEIIRRAILKKL